MLGVAVGAVAAMALWPAGAMATPTVTITSPLSGSATNNQTPSFSGTSSELVTQLETGQFRPVVLRVWAGATAQNGPEAVPKMQTALPEGGWTLRPVSALAPGVYTAQAEQEGIELGELGKSAPVTFTVDTTPPQVTLTSPANGSSTINTSPLISGSVGTAAGDLPEVTVQLFAGSTAGSAALESLTVQASGAGWSTTLGGLRPGTYTVRGEQLDGAGNLGLTSPVTFTITTPPAPPPPPPPVASFKWFPLVPAVGETVSLVSNSTDESSPLTAFAWSLSSNLVFSPGKPILTTSFSAPGPHIVRLRVTAANGLSTVASETVPVVPQHIGLMDPFPVVRIAGRVTSAGVNVSLLTVQAPVGAHVKVTCRGRGCPTASVSRLAASSSRKTKATMVVIAFKRFQSSLRAGAVLEIRIYKHGVIGKFTRFVIRRGKLPVRIDTCVGEAGTKPIACPSS
jgi:hypothetical protein